MKDLAGNVTLNDILVRDDRLVNGYFGNRLRPLEWPNSGATFEDLLKLIFAPHQPPPLGARAAEGPWAHDDLRFRFSYARVNGSRLITLRHVQTDVRTPEALLLPPQVVEQTLRLQSGMIVFAGEMGSGKSTAVASLIRAYAELHAEHIVTIEDPVELVHPPIVGRSMINQRELGKDCESFARGLYEARRQKAKVILIGEIRDEETAEQCLRAAMMGTLIFCTIHGGDVPEAIRSFLQELAPGRQDWGANALAAACRIVVACRLPRDEEKDLAWPIHEVLFNLKRDAGVAAHIRTGEFGKLTQDIEANRGPRLPYYMQSFKDSLLMRITEKRLPRSLLSED